MEDATGGTCRLGVRLDAMSEYAHRCPRLGIGDHQRMDAPAALQQAVDRHLAGSAPAALAFSGAAEIALIDFPFAIEEEGFVGKPVRDQLAQLLGMENRGVAIDAAQLRRRARRNASDEMPDQLQLNTCPQPAPPPDRIHLTMIAFSSYLFQPLLESWA